MFEFVCWFVVDGFFGLLGVLFVCGDLFGFDFGDSVTLSVWLLCDL